MNERTGIARSHSDDWPIGRIVELKGQRRIAVVIPARNEQATVGDVVRTIREDLSDVVDDLIVMDSLSHDDTALVAESAGASVYSVTKVRPDLGVYPGKGEALWKSLFVTQADLLVFIDADLTDWGSHFISGLVGPLLANPEIQLVRGFYDRVMEIGEAASLEGGRVTELVARPWLSLYRPELVSIVQPLAGEWAMRRSAFEELSIPMGYGVELSTLLDVFHRWGVRGIQQVDLGRRAHRHQSLHDLSAMSVEVFRAAELRRPGLVPADSLADSGVVHLSLPLPDRSWDVREVPVKERPPHVSLR